MIIILFDLHSNFTISLLNSGSLIGDAIRNVEAVVQSGLSTAEGLAVDWIALKLVFCIL